MSQVLLHHTNSYSKCFRIYHFILHRGGSSQFLLSRISQVIVFIYFLLFSGQVSGKNHPPKKFRAGQIQRFGLLGSRKILPRVLWKLLGSGWPKQPQLGFWSDPSLILYKCIDINIYYLRLKKILLCEKKSSPRYTT